MASRCDLDLGKLVFQEATHEQKIQSWRNNSDSWAGKMTVDQYIGQQARNGNRTITRNGGIRYWVLTSADGEEVYCSGETVRKPLAALVPSRNGSSSASENRQFFRQGSWGVGGVFTPVRYRRRGLTSMLMRCIREWIDSQAATSAMSTFSALWSAVGTFYERFGWSVCATKEAVLHIPVLPLPCAAQTAPKLLRPAGGDSTTTEATNLTRDDLTLRCQRDAEAVASDIGHTPLISKNDARLAFEPTYDVADWHFGSEEYVASVLFGPDRVPG